MLLWRWLVLLLLVLLFSLLLLLWLGLLVLLLRLLLLLLSGRTRKINRFLIRRCWPDRACGGDKSVPRINFWDQLGCPSRWWRW